MPLQHFRKDLQTNVGRRRSTTAISMAEIAIDEDYMHNQTKCIPKIGDRLQKAYPKDFPSAPSDWLIKSKIKEMTDPYKAVDGKFMDTRQKDTGCLPVSEHASELQRLSIALGDYLNRCASYLLQISITPPPPPPPTPPPRLNILLPHHDMWPHCLSI